VQSVGRGTVLRAECIGRGAVLRARKTLRNLALSRVHWSRSCAPSKENPEEPCSEQSALVEELRSEQGKPYITSKKMLKTNISHFSLTEKPCHINYRLFGSVPQTFLAEAVRKRQIAFEKLSIELLSFPNEYRQVIYDREAYSINCRFEFSIDEALHKTKDGPFYLQEVEFREIILNSWLTLQNRRLIIVIAVCVMGNHVHVIVRTPDGADPMMPGALLQRHKSYTARECNKLLKKINSSFWDSNYYDRVIRKGKFITAVWYVLNNPVKAGLVEKWTDWPGTYLNHEYAGLFE
jgi:putative transposase